MSARLKQCVDVGGVVALFPLLADWPPKELKALMRDIASYQKQAAKELDAAYQELAFKPENLFDRSRQKMVDEARDNARISLLATCSEIASVALYYLDAHKESRSNAQS